MNGWIRWSGLACIVAFMAPNSALAQDETDLVARTNKAEQPIVTDRPDVAEASRTVPDGALQIEAGVDGQNTPNGAFGMPTKIRYGLTYRWEVHLESDIFRASTESASFADLDVGGKVHILDARGPWIPSMGLLLAITTPTGDGPWAASPTILADWLFTDNLALGVNVGTTSSLSRRGEVDDSIQWATSLGVGIVGGLGAYGEFFGTSTFDGDQVTLSTDGGLTYLINDDLQLDAYVRWSDFVNAGFVDGLGGGVGVSWRTN